MRLLLQLSNFILNFCDTEFSSRFEDSSLFMFLGNEES